MLQQADLGSGYGDDAADLLRDGLEKINSSLEELYSSGRFSGTAVSGTAVSSGVQNTAVETSLLPTGIKSLSVPSAFWEGAGKSLELQAWGYYSSLVSTPGTMRLRLKLGSTVLGDTGAFALVENQSAQLWRLSAVITPFTVGLTGSLMVQAVFEQGISGGSGSWLGWPLVNTAAISIDLTSDLLVGVTAEFSTAHVSNEIKCTNARLFSPVLLTS
jgi:hypothetical protein